MWNLHPKSISIQSKSTSNVQGGQVVTYADLHTGVAARIQPVSANWKLIYAQRNIQVSHSVFTQTNVSDIRPGAIVVFGSRKFLIKGVRNLQEEGNLWVLDCQETTNSLIVEE